MAVKKISKEKKALIDLYEEGCMCLENKTNDEIEPIPNCLQISSLILSKYTVEV